MILPRSPEGGLVVGSESRKTCTTDMISSSERLIRFSPSTRKLIGRPGGASKILPPLVLNIVELMEEAAGSLVNRVD